MNITVLDDYTDTLRTLPDFSRLAGHSVTVWNDHTDDLDALAKRLQETDVLIPIRDRTQIRAPLIEKLDRLKLISGRGTHTYIDVPALTKKGILLCTKMPDRSAPSYATAELAWGLLLACMRRIPQQMTDLRAGKWQTEVGYGLRGKTLGIYGYGGIGRVVAGYGKAFGMKVMILGRENSIRNALQDGYEAAKSEETFFAECDAISLQLKLNNETRGIVGSQQLSRMKPTAVLINTARSGLIEPGALLDALKKGRPGMAGIDVFDEEPITTSNELINLPNIVATPHLGFVEHSSYNKLCDLVVSQILAYVDGKPINVVNSEVLKKSS